MVAGVAALVLAPSAHAAFEQIDAGDLPVTAQDLGDEAVTDVEGAFSSGSDADVYRICLSGDRSFSAQTIVPHPRDTQLFLFDSDGLGVYANDDPEGVPGARWSLLPADHPLTPVAAGEYYLAVSPHNRDPQSALGAIFPDVSGVVDARERGSSQPLAGWMGRSGSSGPYRIELTGTKLCVPPDTTAPTVTIHSPANAATVPQGARVVVDYECADEGGSGLASCAASVADGALLDTSALGDVSVTVTARDHAGNETVVTHTVTVVDRTAPEVAVASPVEGAQYELGAVVAASYSCRDEPSGSGLAICAGDVPNGAPLDTASVGLKSFTVRATDRAGNATTETVSYRVVYAFDGFDVLPRRKRLKAGQLVLVSFRLEGFEGAVPVVPGYPRVVECGSARDGDAARGLWLRKRKLAKLARRARWHRDSERFTFLWKTDRGWTGSCREFVLRLDDGSEHRVEVEFRGDRAKN